MGDVQRHRDDIMGEIAREYASLDYTPTLIIVSSEHIHSRLRTPDDLVRAKALLQPFCTRFEVVVYLRSQVSIAHSLATTAVRDGATQFRPLPDFATANGFDELLGVDFNYFDYTGLLARLETVFGATALRVRLYERAELRNANVIDDFFAAIGVNLQNMVFPGIENPGLNRRATLFLVAFNQYAPRDEHFMPARARLIDYFNTRCIGSMPPAPLAAREAFMHQFLSGNEAVRKKYFSHRISLFAPDQDGAGTEDCLAQLSMQEIFSMFASVLMDECK
jgi:hypothetical protein